MAVDMDILVKQKTKLKTEPKKSMPALPSSPIKKGKTKLFKALGVNNAAAKKKYQITVSVEYDPEYDKIPRSCVDSFRSGSMNFGGSKPRKNNWDDGSQPLSAKAK